MRRRVLLAVAGAVVVVAALAALVAARTGTELAAARRLLDASVEDVGAADLREAGVHLRNARNRLHGPAALLLRAVPVLGTNLRALDAAAAAAIPALDTALEVRGAVDRIQAEGLVTGGTVNLGAIAGLRAPLGREVEALAGLESEAADRKSGWLLPPVWDALDGLQRRAHDLRRSTEGLGRLLELAPRMLGQDTPRRYLVVLINNAELRGGGGLLAGVGTVIARDGRLRVGRLYQAEELQTVPPETVPAPTEYERRFGPYQANTTLWKNTTFSPDVPDDALVAARLFEHVTGTATEGAIVVDPRGLAALLPPDAALPIPGLDHPLGRDEFADFVYSEAYRRFTDERERRASILAAGGAAFEAILGGGLLSEEGLGAAGVALAGGHLRIVSFEAAEADVLEALGVSGRLESPEGDSLLVTVQNFGGGGREGSKMDFWARRQVEQACSLAPGEDARCATTVRLRNVAPSGLPRYVAGTPYGLLRSYLETYVPEDAEVIGVVLDGEPAAHQVEPQAGRVAIGVYVEVPPGGTAEVEVRYVLPGSGQTYSLVALPQPLVRDADLLLALRLPRDWEVIGPGAWDGDVWRYRGGFAGPVGILAGPDQRSGIPRIWDALTDFWRGPLF
ncbi:MAG TPA: DUF4012 domain-containing protein [Actinomycetota bacterium]|nr:DUF4012 domain-containing protein [Actinomycetota bacterium]